MLMSTIDRVKQFFQKDKERNDEISFNCPCCNHVFLESYLLDKEIKLRNNLPYPPLFWRTITCPSCESRYYAQKEENKVILEAITDFNENEDVLIDPKRYRDIWW